MKILTANSGSYPRVGPEPEHLRLRETYQKWEKGEASDEELEEVYQDYAREIIQEQEKAGLDVVTDGLIRWYDPFSHFARNVGGCEINGLLRYFDTNFYYRQPVIVDELNWEEPTVKNEFVSAREVTEKTLKAVVTGPYTLAKNSINQNYDQFSDLVLDFTDIIAREIEELVEAGAKEIQVNEPAILKNGEDYEMFSEGVEKLSDASDDSQLDLYVYFGDSTPLYERLQELPIDLLGLDFTYSPDLPDLIEEKGSEKSLGLGLIDARNTKMEETNEVISILERIVPQIDSEEVYLNPSCGIELLPRERAFEKLKKTVQIAEKFEEEL